MRSRPTVSEINDFDQPDPPEAGQDDEEQTAAALPFKKKTPEPELAPGEVRPGEWQADLPDDTDADDEAGLSEGAPVDPPKQVYPPSVKDWMSEHDKVRRPVLPDWVKLPDQRKAVRKWAVRHYGTVIGYHAVRIPCVYTPKLLAYAPRGAW